MSVTVRPATTAEHATVLSILDGAALATDAARVAGAIDRDAAIVAVAEDGGDGRVLGALVLDGEEIVNVAVRPGRRGQGVGRALIEAAAERRESLAATFDPGVRPFYEALGFDVEPVEEDTDYADRLRGQRD